MATTDGGATWRTANLPAGVGFVGAGSLAFVDARRGWLVTESGTIFVTRDGGATWAPQYRAPYAAYARAATGASMMMRRFCAAAMPSVTSPPARRTVIVEL